MFYITFAVITKNPNADLFEWIRFHICLNEKILVYTRPNMGSTKN